MHRLFKRATPPTTTQHTQHQQPLPHLPPELWSLIFRYAASSTPDPRPVSFLSLAHSHCHLHQRLQHYRATMATKATLTLLSKSSLPFAQDVFFEFVWISCAREARALAHVLSGTGPSAGCGKYIRRLHIETPTLERCDPKDLRTILDYAPRLEVYSDYRSVRRSNYQEDPRGPPSRSSPRELLSALAHPNNSLRRLSWTNYDDFSFHLHMSPMLETTAAHLEFLELTFCATHLQSVAKSSSPSSSLESLLSSPDQITLTLPALRSLKVTLDNATFEVLASWTMPALQNISVLSADFSYAASGFSHFFQVHGPKLVQLELGHSSSTIEEHYLTSPPPSTTSASPFTIPPLAAWCPNLREFICSADAEWNWQNPDWIAPHVLLPTHPALQLIGIRDIDKRIRGDGGGGGGGGEEYFGLLEQVGSLLRREAFPSLRYVRDMSWESDVMRRGVPARQRAGTCGEAEGPRGDGGGGGDGAKQARGARGIFRRRRRAQTLAGAGAGAPHGHGHGDDYDPALGPAPPPPSRETRRVLRFWESVLERCRSAGVWLEDYRGVNITVRDLRRAEAGKERWAEFVEGEGEG
ncbi:hypothetical protein H0H92_006191, partial [Tricholoma furcatifolium]